MNVILKFCNFNNWLVYVYVVVKTSENLFLAHEPQTSGWRVTGSPGQSLFGLPGHRVKQKWPVSTSDADHKFYQSLAKSLNYASALNCVLVEMLHGMICFHQNQVRLISCFFQWWCQRCPTATSYTITLEA